MEYLLEGLAAEAQKQGQQTRYKAYLTALRSMQKYPLPLKSGQEAMMLEGVGPNIAFKLDQLLPRLHKEIEKNKRTATTKTTTSRTAGHKRTREGDDAPAGPDENASESAHNAGPRLAASASREATERPDELPNKRPRSRAYTPRLRSIPYAVVMALSRGPAGDPMSRATLLTTAASFCDSPAVTGDKEDGAWKTAISTLVKKGFVQRHPLRSTPHYSLTTEGEELAERLSRTTTTTTGKEDSAPAPRSVVRAATAVSSVATAKASASAGQLHGHDSNEDSCDIDADDNDDDDNTGYRRSAVQSKKKAAPSGKERRRPPSEDEDKENRENGAGGVTQGGWESSGKQTSSSLSSSTTKPRVTIDLCASPSPSASPSYHPHHDYNFDYSPLGAYHRLSPYRGLTPASPNRLLHPFLHTQHSSSSSTTMAHAGASSPAAPTAPYKPSFRFGYVNEDEQWCTYRWEAAEKFHEGERYYRISTMQDPTLWDSHYRLLVSPFRKSAATNLHRAWLREDDAPVCARAPIVAEDAATGPVAEAAAAAAESGSDRENATRLPTGKRTRGGLARRNLTTELDDVVADGKTTTKAATAQAASRKPKRGKKNVTEKESESEERESENEKERKRRAARGQAEATTTARQRQRRRALPRDAYEVVMLVDTREIAGKGNAKGGKSRKTIFQEMVKRGIACEERSLALGDFMWIARDKRRGTEYVMDVIVERKKVDDLWASIKDGRYYEQKFRLARSGVERVVYIVEGALQAGGNPHKTWNQLPVDTLESALVSTQVGNDFVVQRCATLRESISFLKSLTRQLTARTEPITLRDDDEDDDNDDEQKDNDGAKIRALWEIGRWSEKVSKSGNLTITDVFAKQLLQINGVSPAKAKAITDRYATPRKLAKAYDRCADKAAREALLAQLTAGGRKLGPVLSKRVHDAMWTTITPSRTKDD